VEGAVLATSGIPVPHTRVLPLALGGERVGELVVGLRPGDLSLPADDQHVLDLTAPLLAQTLRARALARDLQESREQTITALEEERRRLRRDLHDGLGPRLSGIAFTSDAARNSLEKDPGAAADLLRSVRAETVAAIEEIRGLVYAMRPPALDELGLVPALRQASGTLSTPEGRPLLVTIDAGDLPPLSAAVEVAAYRITLEALTNAARHSGGDRAEACLQHVEGHLVIEVRDSGSLHQDWPTGVGLSSMRERAAELGGTLTASHSPEGGRVHAVLPLPG
jgi:signal transduction histidine kinase